MIAHRFGQLPSSAVQAALEIRPVVYVPWRSAPLQIGALNDYEIRYTTSAFYRDVALARAATQRKAPATE